jgi:hypothetical protein
LGALTESACESIWASRIIISGQFLLEAFILSVDFLNRIVLYSLFSGPLLPAIFHDVQFASQMLCNGQFTSLFVTVTTLVAFTRHILSTINEKHIQNKLGGGKGKANLLHQSLMVFRLFLAVGIVAVTLIAGRQRI